VVKRRASKRSVPPERAEQVIAQGDALLQRHGLHQHHSERQLAQLGLRLLDAETAAQKASTATDERALREARAELSLLLDWLVARRPDLERAGFLSWRLPHPTDYQNLVPLRRVHPALPEQITGAPEHQRRRDGFVLTDPRKPRLEVLAEVDYCLYCHERNKDSCSKGFHDKKRRGEAKPARRPAHRLPARREDLRDAHAAAAWRLARVRWPWCDRQPPVRGHRAPHLQRLHEGLHLPEARAGQHPADRDGC
jgi:hypothetical protein